MGLSFTRDVVRAHGGELELAATDSSGAQFRITLPLARSSA